jgi:hypothetical protein
MAASSEAEALNALEAFESVGVTLFCSRLLAEDTGAVEEADVLNGARLRERLPFYLERNATRNESFIISVRDSVIVQVDDCDEFVHAWLRPFAFLTVKTSPGNYQAWLCLTDTRTCNAVRERVLRRLSTLSGNGGAYGGLRWPGSRNCKLKHRGPEGSFPMVEITSVSPGRRVTAAELAHAHLLAPPLRKFRPVVRQLWVQVLYATGMVWFAAWWNRKRVIILSYRGITKGPAYIPKSRQAEQQLAYESFIKQLEYLRRRYHVVALSEYLAARRERTRLPDYSVILTFEGEYRNFLTVAAPCLAESGLPATVFVFPKSMPQGRQSDNSRSWLLVDDDRNLSWEELDVVRRELGLEVGLLLRPVLDDPALIPDDAIRQLREGYVEVVKQTGQDGVPLAFRYGEYTLAAAREAALIGFSCAIARCDFGVNDMADDPVALQCMWARDIGDDSLSAFALQISGFKVWWWRLTGQTWEALR